MGTSRSCGQLLERRSDPAVQLRSVARDSSSYRVSRPDANRYVARERRQPVPAGRRRRHRRGGPWPHPGSSRWPGAGVVHAEFSPTAAANWSAPPVASPRADPAGENRPNPDVNGHPEDVGPRISQPPLRGRRRTAYADEQRICRRRPRYCGDDVLGRSSPSAADRMYSPTSAGRPPSRDAVTGLGDPRPPPGG